MMTWKGCRRKQLWPNLRYDPSIYLEGLRKTMENISQDSQSSRQDMNLSHPEYEAGVLTT
jgi:hypothetical protein